MEALWEKMLDKEQPTLVMARVFENTADRGRLLLTLKKFTVRRVNNVCFRCPPFVASLSLAMS